MTTLIERPCTICAANDHRLLMAEGESGYRECRQCGAIFTSPMAVHYEDVNEAAYEAAITRYAAKIDAKLDVNMRTLKPFDKYRQRNTFLELGCNAGATLVAAEQLGWQVTGVDISRAATAYAREQRGLNAITGTLEQAALPADHFDVIYSNAVLEHIEHPLQTMQEARRILRAGGAFFADTVNWDSYTQRFLGHHWRYLEPLHHVQLYTPSNVRELARRSGFTVERVWTTGIRLSDHKPGLEYQAPAWLQACKGPLSLATRFTHKGDSIKFLLRKAE